MALVTIRLQGEAGSVSYLVMTDPTNHDPAIAHFDEIILPAIESYFEAENCLSSAVQAGDEKVINTTRLMVMRTARTAAIELHQFSDRVAKLCPAWGPGHGQSVEQVRQWLRVVHAAAISSDRSDEVLVLQDIADAMKHAQLDHAPRGRERFVDTDKAVLFFGSGFGEFGFGEAKYGGVEQVMVVQSDGTKRLLSSTLDIVKSAWLRAMGRD